jgi:signal transduction histidine kinase
MPNPDRMMTKNRIIRLLPAISIVMILAGYLYLTLQTIQLAEKRKELIDDIRALDKIKQRMTADAKAKDTIIRMQQTIIAGSDDRRTVEKGAQLARKISHPEGDFFTKNDTSASNLVLARRFENEGYLCLLDRDVQCAITAFRKSENAFNGYHQVYEIARFLDRNKQALSDPAHEFWQTTYSTILKDYNWKMPEDFKEQLIKLSGRKVN